MPLTNPQKKIFDDKNRFRICAAGRRSGKTFLSIWEMARVARYPNKKVFYIAPSFRMAKQIIFEDLKTAMIQRNWAKKINESDLSIALINGSKISLRSADNADSMRGVSLDFAVLDECAFMEEKTWTEVVRPTLSDRRGSALLISTPKGYDWFHQTWTNAHNQADWSAYQYTTLEGGLVTAEEIEQARLDLDLKIFRQEYEASFEVSANNIYHAFDIGGNVKTFEQDIPHRVHIGQDFNIDPGSAIVFAETESGLHIIDEIIVPNSNTDEMAQIIKNKYKENVVTIFPDPAGAARKTSSSNRTDHTILKEYGFAIRTRKAHPSIKDRINSVNRLLCDAAGNRRLYVDPKCKKTIEALNKHAYKEGTNLPDKTSGYDHIMDALGYCVEYLHPIKQQIDTRTKVRAYGI